jgi:hypothetical protein
MFVNYNKLTDYTKDDILHLLSTDNKWVEIALVRLYERQLAVEKAAETTVAKNHVGFQVADAKQFTEFARNVMMRAQRGVPAGQRLTDYELSECRRPWHRGKYPVPTIAKYRGQILDMIETRAKIAKYGVAAN